MTHILLVEDSDDHADIVTRVLTLEPGWTVSRVATRREALAEAERGTFDLAIVDYRLPDGDGLDVLDTLRGRVPGLPVLMLTAHGSEDVALQALSRGAVDYVTKSPHYQRELPLRVAEVLTRLEDFAKAGATVRSAPASAPGASARPASGAGEGPADARFDKDSLKDVVGELVGTTGFAGAAVYDGGGRLLAAAMPVRVDVEALGQAILNTHAHAQHATRKVPDAGLPRVLLVDYATGLMAIAAAPGPLLIALLLRQNTDAADAMKRAREAAQRVWEHSGA